MSNQIKYISIFIVFILLLKQITDIETIVKLLGFVLIGVLVLNYEQITKILTTKSVPRETTDKQVLGNITPMPGGVA